MEKFDIRLILINLAVVLDKYNRILEVNQEELATGAAKLRQMYQPDAASDAAAEKIYAFVLLYQELFEEYKVQAISAECWSAMRLLVGALPCVAYGILEDMGYIIGCESDALAVMTQVLLKSLTFGKKLPFLGEFTTRHPTDRNIELLWLCGPFAYSLHQEGIPCKVVNMQEWFRVKDGHYTIARIDQDHGDYSIAVCTCDSAEGPYTGGTYLWGKFENLSNAERQLIYPKQRKSPRL